MSDEFHINDNNCGLDSLLGWVDDSSLRRDGHGMCDSIAIDDDEIEKGQQQQQQPDRQAAIANNRRTGTELD